MLKIHNPGYGALALGVVLQAVEDWRSLCKGQSESADNNFTELTRFFENEAHLYLSETGLIPEEILKKLQDEKRKAEK